MADADFKPTEEELAALGKSKDEELDDLDIAEIERMRSEDDEDDSSDDETDDETQDDDDKSADDDTSADDNEEPDPVDKKPKGAESKQPSRREIKRVQDLLRKYPDNDDTKQTTTQQALDYAKELDADPELIKRLEADRKAAVDAARQQGNLQQNMLAFETRLDIDAPRVEQKYAILDPNSDKFDGEAAEGVYALYRDLSQYDAQTRTVGNPAFRYAPFADALMVLAKRLAANETEQANKNITKRASRTGLRPDGSSAKAKTKDPMKMSDDEFNKFIGIS